MMRQLLAITTTLVAGVMGIGMTAPASAQAGQRTLIIYGDEPCPTSNGEEIIVCQRRPANEQFRIPKELREAGPDAGDATPGSRVAAMDSASAPQTGMDTCSPVGAGGQTGCFRQAANANKRIRKENRADTSTPLDVHPRPIQ